jgi:hypothetical protein
MASQPIEYQECLSGVFAKKHDMECTTNMRGCGVLTWPFGREAACPLTLESLTTPKAWDDVLCGQRFAFRSDALLYATSRARQEACQRSNRVTLPCATWGREVDRRASVYASVGACCVAQFRRHCLPTLQRGSGIQRLLTATTSLTPHMCPHDDGEVGRGHTVCGSAAGGR